MSQIVLSFLVAVLWFELTPFVCSFGVPVAFAWLALTVLGTEVVEKKGR